MTTLNSFQLSSIAESGNLMITACPGSGKTTVLICRAESFLKKSSQGNLLAVTFTKDAANELKSRILNKFPDGGKRIGSGTFHSLAMKQLKRAGVIIDLMSDYEIYGVVQGILEKLIDPVDVGIMLLRFTDIQSSENPSEHALMADPQTKFAWNNYQEIKKNSNKMDFGDILFLAVRGMKEGAIKPYAARWLFADEAQDMDEIQYAWVKCHADNGSEVTLVGDDDQNVFSFRSSLGFKGMNGFKVKINATSKILPINYRCGKDILNVAIRLIEKNNPNRLDKPIKSGVSYKGKVHDTVVFEKNSTKGVYRSFHEHEKIVDTIILHDHLSKSEHPDWAILARGNQSLNEIERFLLEKKIPYSRKSGSFWDQEPLKTFLNVIAYLIEGKWFGFAIFLNKVLKDDFVFNRKVKSLSDLYKLTKKDDIKERIRSLLYYEMEWKKLLSKRDLNSEGEFLRDVGRFVLGNLNVKSEAVSEKYLQMIQSAISFIENTKANSLKRKIFLRTSPVMNNEKKAEEKRKQALEDKTLFVSLLTLHSSKGLEFDRVWISGCESDNFTKPKKNGAMINIEEERRLFYVGVTRAKYHLYSSLTKTGQAVDAIFLQEAGILKYEKNKEYGE